MVAGPFRGGKRKIPNTDGLGKILCVGVDHEGELGAAEREKSYSAGKPRILSSVPAPVWRIPKRLRPHP